MISPQIPVVAASQQGTVWRCFIVYGTDGFPFDLPDTPYLLPKKMIPALAGRILRAELSFAIGCPGSPGQAKKKGAVK